MTDVDAARPGRDQAAFATLVDFLREERSFEFTGYKPRTLMRRVDRRLDELGIDSYESYTDHLQLNPDEFAALLESLLINVTGFFRDEPVWRTLDERCIPALLAAKGDGEPVRVWVAGCASGEEAYSAAMLLAEHLGDEAAARLKIYATDVDHAALDEARRGWFPASAVESVGEDRRSRWFAPHDGGYSFDADLRRRIVFGRHDLLRDAPISRVDLLLCRNVLMYFNAEAQAGLVNRFHFALADAGYLVLGKAEMLLAHGHLFAPLDPRTRIFVKQADSPRRDRHGDLGDPGAAALVVVADPAHAPGSPGGFAAGGAASLAVRAVEASAQPQILLDAHGRVAVVNAAARDAFDLTDGAVGQPFSDLAVSYRPLELRSAIEEARRTGRAVGRRSGDDIGGDDAGRIFDVEVVPLDLSRRTDAQDSDRSAASALGFLLAFADVTALHRSEARLAVVDGELHAAYEQLQAANEELTTANEELHATIEELETTNEELQSTNEELETMNDELSATNLELSAINDELQDRGAQVDELNAFLGSVLDVMDAAVVVVDRDLRIRAWNRRCTELWDVAAAAVTGRPLVGLDIGLPVGEIADRARAVLGGSSTSPELEIAGEDRRGHSPRYLVRFTGLQHRDGRPAGVVVVLSVVSEPAKPRAGRSAGR
ncbi:MAG: PAS domain-containing protein [Actinobacteria bacterium]|nr:PAS domain-containing protein [Actinomycetota bacterium]